MLDEQVSSAFLITLSLAFGVHGVRELAHACRLPSFQKWIEKAYLDTSGLVLGAVFARCGYWLIGGVEGLSAMAGWFRHQGKPRDHCGLLIIKAFRTVFHLANEELAA